MEQIRLYQARDTIEKEINYRDNPYLASISKGEFDKNDFKETLIQYYFFTTSYAQSLGLLLSRVPEANDQAMIATSLYEEFGKGTREVFRAARLESLLSRFGADIENGHMIWPETLAYILAIRGACSNDWRFAIATLAMMMHINAPFSHSLEQAIEEQNWILSADLSYFREREEASTVHAQEFFAIIEPEWDRHATIIHQGLQFGAYVNDRFYRDLYEHRKRR